jgi:anti-sigma B factor antagonist
VKDKTMRFTWRTHKREGVAVVACSGEVDGDMPPGFRQALLAAAATSGQRLVVDLTGVSYLQSTGLGQLAGMAGTLQQRGGVLAIVCPPGDVARLLKLSGLGGFLHVREDVEAAVAAVKGVGRGPGPRAV